MIMGCIITARRNSTATASRVFRPGDEGFPVLSCPFFVPWCLSWGPMGYWCSSIGHATFTRLHSTRHLTCA